MGENVWENKVHGLQTYSFLSFSFFSPLSFLLFSFPVSKKKTKQAFTILFLKGEMSVPTVPPSVLFCL